MNENYDGSDLSHAASEKRGVSNGQRTGRPDEKIRLAESILEIEKMKMRLSGLLEQ